MKEYVLNKYGCPDIVFNNAAVLHLGMSEQSAAATGITDIL